MNNPSLIIPEESFFAYVLVIGMEDVDAGERRHKSKSI